MSILIFGKTMVDHHISLGTVTPIWKTFITMVSQVIIETIKR